MAARDGTKLWLHRAKHLWAALVKHTASEDDERYIGKVHPQRQQQRQPFEHFVGDQQLNSRIGSKKSRDFH